MCTTESTDQWIVCLSSPPHVSHVPSVVRALLLFVCMYPATLPHCMGLFDALQGQSVAVSAHHHPFRPRRRRAEVTLLAGMCPILLLHAHCAPFLRGLCLLHFSLLPRCLSNEEVVPTLNAGAGAPAVVVSVSLVTRQGPHPGLMDRFVSMWACRSCSAAPMRWRSSVTWVRQTSPRVFGWVWSSEALKGRTMAL